MITLFTGNKFRVADPFVSEEENGDDYKPKDVQNQIDYELKNKADNENKYVAMMVDYKDSIDVQNEYKDNDWKIGI